MRKCWTCKGKGCFNDAEFIQACENESSIFGHGLNIGILIGLVVGVSIFIFAL